MKLFFNNKDVKKLFDRIYICIQDHYSWIIKNETSIVIYRLILKTCMNKAKGGMTFHTLPLNFLMYIRYNRTMCRSRGGGLGVRFGKFKLFNNTQSNYQKNRHRTPPTPGRTKFLALIWPRLDGQQINHKIYDMICLAINYYLLKQKSIYFAL